jgi:hypothetical protein|nr:MAG TPA: hypothetical protein [Caudoviricetes sp.]
MKIDEILKLVNAGYTKDEIASFDVTSDQKTDEKKDQETDEKKDQKTDNSFDYDKFAAALVKAQQIANGKTNFGSSNEKLDISKFF